MITQCSEDETWLEGTLGGHTGWFPSNYVHLLDEDTNGHNANGSDQLVDEQPKHLNNNETEPIEENTRIRVSREILIENSRERFNNN